MAKETDKKTAAAKTDPSAESRPPNQTVKQVDVEVSVELGRQRITLERALQLAEQHQVELNRLAGEPVDVRLNGKLFARGEVVTVQENYGVRLTELIGEEQERS